MNRRDFFKIAGAGLVGMLLPKLGEKIGENIMLPNSGVRYGDLLKEMYDGIKNNNLPASRLDDIQRVFNDLAEREDKYKAWLRPQDNRIGEEFLDVSFFKIFSEKMAADTASLTIPIPPAANHLYIMGSARITQATYVNPLGVRFNGDSGTNYIEEYHGAENASDTNGRVSGQDYISIGDGNGTSATAGANASFWAFAPHIQGEFWKSVQSMRGTPFSGAAASLALHLSGFWQSTDPITSIDIFPIAGSNILAGSFISVYGLK